MNTAPKLDAKLASLCVDTALGLIASESIADVEAGWTALLAGKTIGERDADECLLAKICAADKLDAAIDTAQEGLKAYARGDDPATVRPVSDEDVRRALSARVPGGASVKDWLPTSDPYGRVPSDTAFSVMRAALETFAVGKVKP